MTEPPFVSNAQNGEDVVLRRAFRHILDGRYIDVGANHPRVDSISRSFYDLGWRGITVEPLPHLAAQHRLERPGDVMVEAVITETDGGEVVLHSYCDSDVDRDSGLSTTIDGIRDKHTASGRVAVDLAVDSRRLDSVLAEAGWQDAEIHFMTIDTEGAEGAVLDSIDLSTWRPWVLVIEATLPTSEVRSHQSWEGSVLAAGYEFCLFDGLSRFYVAKEHATELFESLDHPACIHDDYITSRTIANRTQIAALDGRVAALDAQIVELEAQIQTLGAQIETLDDARSQAVKDAVHWRTASLTRWADSVAAAVELAQLREQNACMRGQNAELAELRTQNDVLARAAAANGLEVANMRHTVSWRLTAPIRKVRALTRSRS